MIYVLVAFFMLALCKIQEVRSHSVVLVAWPIRFKAKIVTFTRTRSEGLIRWRNNLFEPFWYLPYCYLKTFRPYWLTCYYLPVNLDVEVMPLMNHDIGRYIRVRDIIIGVDPKQTRP